MKALDRFRFVRRGVWRNDADHLRVSINEDYGRTFIAWYTVTTPSGEWTHPFFNKGGQSNPLPFCGSRGRICVEA